MSINVKSGSDVIVIGGGVIGLAISLELLAHNVKVINIFPSEGDATGASLAAGAMLGAFGELTADDGPDEIEELDFRLAAQRYYPTWLQRIAEISKLPVFEAKGTFIIANNQGVRDRDSILRMKKEAEARHEPAEWVEPSDVPGLDPSPTHAPALSLFLGNENSVHSGELLDALRAALAIQSGYLRMDAEVTELAREGTGWQARMSNGTIIVSSAVVLAGGSRAVQCLNEELAQAAGVPKLYFGKGVSCILSDGPQITNTIRTPNRAFACGIHVVPRPGSGNLYLGATNFMGVDHEFEKKIQPAELHSLFDESIHQINTRIRTSRLENIRVGFRPITAFKRPAIGRTNLPNLFLATGTYRNGILMAPLVAKLIVEEMGLVEPAVNTRNPFQVLPEISTVRADVRKLLDVGIRDIVAFLQEPRSPLPFNRANELEWYIRSLFSIAVFDDEHSIGMRKMIQQRLADAPFNETMHMMFYELVEKARRDKATADA